MLEGACTLPQSDTGITPRKLDYKIREATGRSDLRE
jgi:hypothetical protein